MVLYAFIEVRALSFKCADQYQERILATIVESIKDGDRFVLLGSGFGAYQSKKPNWSFGDLMADTDEGQFAMVCVSDVNGRVGWLESSQVRVVSVDGQSINTIL